MTEIATIDWFGRLGTSVFSENTDIFFVKFCPISYIRFFELLALYIANLFKQLKATCKS